ncbi:MAG: membrane protein of unknown function [Promethearchaeota archaeon]|nr:MAG: membrane protein of unknown function [Candidatus Lokiarchaeota archaeon]
MSASKSLLSFSKEQWALAISGIILGFLNYSLHFLIEFSVLWRRNLPSFMIIFHFLGLIPGAIINYTFFSAVRKNVIFIINASILTLVLLSLYFIPIRWYIPIGLFITGIALAINLGFMFEKNSLLIERVEVGGRSFSPAFLLISILVIILAFLDYINGFILILIFFITLFIVFLGSTRYYLTRIPSIPQHQVRLSGYLKNKKNISSISVAFIFGFFFVNAYYITIIILEENDILFQFNLFLIFLFISIALSSPLVGVIADSVGRRFTLVIGCLIQALAFLILSFAPTVGIGELLIFSIILGVGLAFTLNTMALFFVELPDKKSIRSQNEINSFFMALGLLSGLLLGEVLKPLYLSQPAYLTVVLLFIFILTTAIIFQIEETLPSKEEQEWKNAIQYLYVIQKSGVPIYTEPLVQTLGKKRENDETLISGALTAVSSLMQEIAENKDPLKLIKQEGFSIIIEEGNKVFVAVISLKDLKSIRAKIKAFLEKFEEFFEELLDHEVCDTLAFSPTKKLVEEFFS